MVENLEIRHLNLFYYIKILYLWLNNKKMTIQQQITQELKRSMLEKNVVMVQLKSHSQSVLIDNALASKIAIL